MIAVCPSLFSGDNREKAKDGWMWKSHTSGTDGNLQAAWRQELARPWVAMGTGEHCELNGHRCLCPGLNALGSICQLTQTGRRKEKDPLLPARFIAPVKLNIRFISTRGKNQGRHLKKTKKTWAYVWDKYKDNGDNTRKWNLTPLSFYKSKILSGINSYRVVYLYYKKHVACFWRKRSRYDQCSRLPARLMRNGVNVCIERPDEDGHDGDSREKTHRMIRTVIPLHWLQCSGSLMRCKPSERYTVCVCVLQRGRVGGGVLVF